ncbi:MAG: FtsW/RodA/SpoVE family cell cycle protein, partial [Oscillospiraceae bacterium]
LICIGVSSVFLVQTVLNLGMNLYVLPVIGITLPFFSAGGTSVTMLYLSVGMVLSVYRHNKKNIFDN